MDIHSVVLAFVKTWDPLRKKQIEILTSMKGISVFTAIALISDGADIRRFANSKKCASYLRSAPGVYNSNETTRNVETNKVGKKLWIILLTQYMKVTYPFDNCFNVWLESYAIFDVLPFRPLHWGMAGASNT